MELLIMMVGYISLENNSVTLGNETNYEKNNYSIRPTAFNKQ